MELFVLILFLIICIWLLYTHKKDIMCPSIAITVGYFITCICGLYNYQKWDSNISLIVVLAVIVGLLSFYCGDFLVQKMRKTKANNSIASQENFTLQLKKIHIPPQNWMIIIAIVISSISTYLLIMDVVRIASINYRDWGNLIYNYRHNRSVSKIAAIPRLGNLLTTGLAFSYVFVFVNNIYCENRIRIRGILKNFIFLVPALLYSVQIVFLGGRIGIAICLLELLVIVGIFRMYHRGKDITINIKIIIVLMVSLSVFSSFFFRVKEFVGRDQESDGAIDYVTTYLGASMELFSLYVNDPYTSKDDVEILSGIVDNAQRYFGVLKEIKIDDISEFRQSATGIELGNVYSGFRRYYNDLGFIGIILFGFLLGFIFNSMYYSIRCYRVLNLRRIVLIVFYASYYYCIAFHFFTDYFFSGLSINMISKVLFIVISCAVIYKGKIKI